MSNHQNNACGQQEACSKPSFGNPLMLVNTTSQRCVIFSADCVKTMGSYCHPDVAIKVISLKFPSVPSLKALDEKIRFQPSSLC